MLHNHNTFHNSWSCLKYFGRIINPEKSRQKIYVETFLGDLWICFLPAQQALHPISFTISTGCQNGAEHYQLIEEADGDRQGGVERERPDGGGLWRHSDEERHCICDGTANMTSFYRSWQNSSIILRFPRKMIFPWKTGEQGLLRVIVKLPYKYAGSRLLQGHSQSFWNFVIHACSIPGTENYEDIVDSNRKHKEERGDDDRLQRIFLLDWGFFRTIIPLEANSRPKEEVPWDMDIILLYP